jgi:hypothetical protein
VQPEKFVASLKWRWKFVPLETNVVRVAVIELLAIA